LVRLPSNLSRASPEDIGDTSRTCPGYVPEISRVCLGYPAYVPATRGNSKTEKQQEKLKLRFYKNLANGKMNFKMLLAYINSNGIASYPTKKFARNAMRLKSGANNRAEKRQDELD
jgi:hypothetical protein